ncbi:MAG TPA: NUDIX hydrolase, partial [Flavobacterium sp.]|nr:NUDIX hydrolase [Flavobacterium sp.]
TIEETALREVQEETGVDGLVIAKKLQKTYHVFKRNGRYKLKITTWFEMETNFHGIPKGQEDEGIEQVAWIKQNEIDFILQNSYENIKLLFHS